MMPLHHAVDVEPRIGVRFARLGGGWGGMRDSHGNVKAGKVYGVRAVVGPSVGARNW